MQNKRIYRFYSKSEKNKPRVCIYGEWNNGTMTISVSRCSEKDHFVRKKARLIAEGRHAKGVFYDKAFIESPPKNEEFIDDATRMSQDVINTKKTRQ